MFHFIVECVSESKPKYSLKVEAEKEIALQIGLLQAVFAVFWHQIYLEGVHEAFERTFSTF